jgi:hypothetical protein
MERFHGRPTGYPPRVRLAIVTAVLLGALQSLARLAAYALRRRIGCQVLRMRFFQLLQAPHELVIFGIADLGLIEHIVQIFVVFNFFPQLFNLAVNGIRHGRNL